MSATHSSDQVLEAAFDIMVAYHKLPHGLALDPPLGSVNRPGVSFDDLPLELPEHYVSVCVQCIYR